MPAAGRRMSRALPPRCEPAPPRRSCIASQNRLEAGSAGRSPGWDDRRHRPASSRSAPGSPRRARSGVAFAGKARMRPDNLRIAFDDALPRAHCRGSSCKPCRPPWFTHPGYPRGPARVNGWGGGGAGARRCGHGLPPASVSRTSSFAKPSQIRGGVLAPCRSRPERAAGREGLMPFWSAAAVAAAIVAADLATRRAGQSLTPRGRRRRDRERGHVPLRRRALGGPPARRRVAPLVAAAGRAPAHGRARVRLRQALYLGRAAEEQPLPDERRRRSPSGCSGSGSWRSSPSSWSGCLCTMRGRSCAGSGPATPPPGRSPSASPPPASPSRSTGSPASWNPSAITVNETLSARLGAAEEIVELAVPLLFVFAIARAAPRRRAP